MALTTAPTWEWPAVTVRPVVPAGPAVRQERGERDRRRARPERPVPAVWVARAEPVVPEEGASKEGPTAERVRSAARAVLVAPAVPAALRAQATGVLRASVVPEGAVARVVVVVPAATAPTTAG